MFERLRLRDIITKNQPEISFEFPVGTDPQAIAEEVERTILERELAESLPPATVAEEQTVFDAAEVIGSLLEQDPNASFLGDDLVFEDHSLTKGLEAAINGVNSTVITREIFVDRKTGAMKETVFVVKPDTDHNGVITVPLRSRDLRSPESTASC